MTLKTQHTFGFTLQPLWLSKITKTCDNGCEITLCTCSICNLMNSKAKCLPNVGEDQDSAVPKPVF